MAKKEVKSKKINTKKTNIKKTTKTVKKTTKKIEKVKPIVEEQNIKETKIEIAKDNESKKKCIIMAVLYLVCALCWIISAYLDLKEDSKSLIGYVDIGLSAVWIMFAIFYFKGFNIEKE